MVSKQGTGIGERMARAGRERTGPIQVGLTACEAPDIGLQRFPSGRTEG